MLKKIMREIGRPQFNVVHLISCTVFFMLSDSGYVVTAFLALFVGVFCAGWAELEAKAIGEPEA